MLHRAFFELVLCKNHSPVKWLPKQLPIEDSGSWDVVTGEGF